MNNKPSYYNFFKNDQQPQGCSEVQLKSCFCFVDDTTWIELLEFINDPKAKRRTWRFRNDKIVIVKEY